jgi:ATP-dependent Lhr-like helicase
MHPTESAVADNTENHGALANFREPVRAWFLNRFPGGPTPAQTLAWPLIAAGEHVLLVSPTGTGKTLAAFLAILDRLFHDQERGALKPGLRCVYVSPLRSLNYDIERNLSVPLAEIQGRIGERRAPVRVGVRTGDTSPYQRRLLRDRPPHVLITTPESLALLLSQPIWAQHWHGVEHLIVDEVHAMAPTKRGADLAVSLERLSAQAARDPVRIGLSATCRPVDLVSRYLVGPTRSCRVIEAQPPECHGGAEYQIEVESLIQPGEAPHRGLSYRRLHRRLQRAIAQNRTTVIFANTRAFAERVTLDLKTDRGRDPESSSSIMAHHSALDALRRRSIEADLRSGSVSAVVTSTSLELGVDIGTADQTIQIGLPGGVARCLQRIGRSGHRPGTFSRGLLLAATAAELFGAAITARAARARRIEPIRMSSAPLDIVCQQLVGMACAGEQTLDDVFEMFRRTGPMAELSRGDFDDCLAYLAGELSAPAGAYAAEPGGPPRWTSPRLWKRNGRFGVRDGRVCRWFRSNSGTIHSEEMSRVVDGGVAIGTLESSYAERLVPGDRFVLDGRALEVKRVEGSIIHTKAGGGQPSLPRWTSDRQSLSLELAVELAEFRAQAGRRLNAESAGMTRAWLAAALEIDFSAAGVLTELFEAQLQWSIVPDTTEVLVEESPDPAAEGTILVFHAPLHRSGCEALARATAARLGRCLERNLSIGVADLGWSIRIPGDTPSPLEAASSLFSPDGFAEDVLEGVDRGELLARRFRQVAATGLMILRNPEPGRRVRVGGFEWASTRLYPLVQAVCPGHPLLRETRRVVLEDVLDVPSALAWLESGPIVRKRSLPTLSPFAAAWIAPVDDEPLQFESAADALRRLHSRLIGVGVEGATI